ncbi:MAG: 1-deoxy-D-xylulose-5-phosphate reductoisomerase, partial [Limnohabitans sp.]
MSIKQRITVLGSTGSIGKNTLDVLARHPDRFSVYALTASTQVDLMFAQCAQFKPQVAVMVEPLAARSLSEKLKAEGIQTEVRSGTLALDEVASAPDVDAVMAAIVGAAGLSPCLAAARAGKRLLLANKEALVVGGEVFLSAVKEG